MSLQHQRINGPQTALINVEISIPRKKKIGIAILAIGMIGMALSRVVSNTDNNSTGDFIALASFIVFITGGVICTLKSKNDVSNCRNYNTFIPSLSTIQEGNEDLTIESEEEI